MKLDHEFRELEKQLDEPKAKRQEILARMELLRQTIQKRLDKTMTELGRRRERELRTIDARMRPGKLRLYSTKP